MTAMHEFVVPKSMPITFAIEWFLDINSHNPSSTVRATLADYS
jgi:hypothetical protein